MDLSYPFEETTIYWPTAKPFQHEEVAYGRTEAGYWYSSFNYAASEHGAPIWTRRSTSQRASNRWSRSPSSGTSVRESRSASPNRLPRIGDYRLTAADILSLGGASREDSFRSHCNGAHRMGPLLGENRAEYLGSEKQDDASDLHFPGIARDAAEFLANEREIAHGWN